MGSVILEMPEIVQVFRFATKPVHRSERLGIVDDGNSACALTRWRYRVTLAVKSRWFFCKAYVGRGEQIQWLQSMVQYY